MLHSRVFIQSLLNTKVFLANTPDVKGKVLEISTVEDFDNDALINMYIQKNQINSIVVSAPVEVIPKKPYFKYMTNVDFSSASTMKIGDSVFEGNTNIKKVQLSASIKELGNRCFYASRIEEIILDYITTFGDECFAYAPRIKSMSIGATQIPKSFAQNAIGLQTLEFTNGGVSVNTSAFAYCINLTTIPFSKINVYGEQSFEYSGLTGFRFMKNTKQMLASAFRYSNINNVVFDPDYNKDVSVSVRQFMGTLVTKINFSKIDATSCLFMFAECQLLEEIYMDPKYVKVPTSFCENCRNLKKYTSVGAETVEEKAFYNCRSLKECNLPKAKTFFPKAFQFCEQLEMDLSAAKDIQGYAFGFCHKINITNMKYTGEFGQYTFEGCQGIEELVINCTLGAGTFQGCINLKKVTFGSNCNTVNTQAFSNCTSLKEINFNGFISTMEDSVFSNSSEIECLNLTAVQSMMFYAFENSKVKSVILGDTEMQRFVFHNCFNLKKVILSKYCEHFFAAAFDGLEDIEFVVDSENKKLILKDGVLTRNDGTLLAVLPSYASKTYTVPDEITFITKHAFTLAKSVEKLEINHFLTMDQQNFSYYLKELVINNQDKENKIVLESFHLSGLQK